MFNFEFGNWFAFQCEFQFELQIEFPVGSSSIAVKVLPERLSFPSLPRFDTIFYTLGILDKN